jgi:hypothetical protein
MGGFGFQRRAQVPYVISRNHHLMNTTTRLVGLRLFAAAAFLTQAMLLAPSSLFAQASQYYHTAGIVLDDGAGHTITLLPPTSGAGGGTITLPPAGLLWPTTNLVGVLTNDGSGNLSWGSGGSGVYLPLAGGTMAGAADPLIQFAQTGGASQNDLRGTGGTWYISNSGSYYGDGSHLSGIPSAFLPLSGGTLTGSGSPLLQLTQTGGVTDKDIAGTGGTWYITHGGSYYGDGSHLSGIGGAFLPLAGGTMSGAIAMGGNNITNVGQMAIASTTPIEDLTVGAGFGTNQTPVMVAGSATDAGSLFLGYSHPTVTANARYDGGGWKYNGAGPATMIDLVSGALAVDNAPSGSAGGGISWTARMNLDASGNLSLPTGGLTTASDASVNGVIVGTQGGGQSTVVGNGARSSSGNTTAIGYFALNTNTGTDNTAVGTNALRNDGSPNTNYNTGIGKGAGETVGGFGGDHNTFVGYQARAGALVTNATAIGDQSTVLTSNTIQLGNSSVTSVNTSGTIIAGGFAGSGTTAFGYSAIATGTTVSSATATIYSVNANAGSGSTATLSATGTNGQIAIFATDDAGGLTVTVGSTPYTIAFGTSLRFVWTGGATGSWKAEF